MSPNKDHSVNPFISIHLSSTNFVLKQKIRWNSCSVLAEFIVIAPSFLQACIKKFNMEKRGKTSIRVPCFPSFSMLNFSMQAWRNLRAMTMNSASYAILNGSHVVLHGVRQHNHASLVGAQVQFLARSQGCSHAETAAPS